ncbi:MAG: hypothetical protein KAX53_00640 [Saprospiraceae bacterium]|jgi:hypothetical protein|nr:hypothetical protein [Saprospiraceae bacterium]MBP8212221.1 hypothetical protein [Saprospiraceae bacterium]
MDPNNIKQFVILLKKEIQERILNQREGLLKEELVLLLKQEKYNICQNFDDFVAIQFEYDSPIDFYFVGYPTTELFDNWNETAIISLDPEVGYKQFRDLRNEYISDQLLFNIEFGTAYQKMIENLQIEFFTKCWKFAKEQTNSKKRCFLFEHDMSTCWDCDYDERIHESEIKIRV